MADLFTLEVTPPKEINRCVVRLSTSCWHDKNGVYLKRSLTFLKRQCQGFNILYEDSGMVGTSDVIERIVNLNECEDGVYQVNICNEFAAWETPNIIEDYDYELIPYTEPTKPT